MVKWITLGCLICRQSDADFDIYIYRHIYRHIYIYTVRIVYLDMPMYAINMVIFYILLYKRKRSLSLSLSWFSHISPYTLGHTHYCTNHLLSSGNIHAEGKVDASECGFIACMSHVNFMMFDWRILLWGQGSWMSQEVSKWLVSGL